MSSLFVPGTSVPTRLLALMDRLRERKVALVAATAGSGKTALVRAWFEADRELSSNTIVLVLRPGATEHSTANLRALIATRPGDGIIPVFIDKHDSIDDSGFIHEVLDLIESNPRLRLILAGRTRPAVPLSGLAIRGQLVEIGPADLALTPDEQREVLSRLTPGISDEMLAQVDDEYRGWPIALELLGNQEFTDASLASARSIIDGYLEEEVLEGVSRADLELLEALSTLSEFTPLGAAHLTGRADAGARLTHLSAQGLPLEWTGSNTVRLHPALRRYLQERLVGDPERLQAVNRRAAEWLQRQGQPRDAIRHALSAQDVDLFSEQFLAYLVDMLPDANSGVNAFVTEIAAQVAAPTLLQLAQLTLLTLEQPESKPVSSATILERDMAAFSAPAHMARFYSVALFVSRTVNYQRSVDMVERAVAFCERVRTTDLAAEIGQLELGLLMLQYGAFLSATGLPQQAEDALQRGIAAARLAGVEWLANLGIGQLAWVHADLGRTSSALRLAQECVAGLQSVPLPRRELFAEPGLLALCSVHLERGHVDEAAAVSARLGAAEQLDPCCAPELVTLGAELKLQQGDARAALRVIEDFERSNPTLTPAQRSRLAAARCQAHTILGDYAEAERDVAIVEASPDLPQSHIRATVLRGRLLLSQGQATQAYDVLTELVHDTRTQPNDRFWLNLLMALGIACTATDRNEEALDAFQSAGVLAETLGLNTPNARHTQIASQLRPDELNLTAAERNVLAHLSGGNKLSQIAEDLFISPNTLKTHLRRIYRKLGVADRHEAVARARALGIRPH